MSNKDSGKPQKVLQVPQKDMAKAAKAMQNIGVGGTVKKYGWHQEAFGIEEEMIDIALLGCGDTAPSRIGTRRNMCQNTRAVSHPMTLQAFTGTMRFPTNGIIWITSSS